MRLTLIGGGGSRTPLLYSGLLERSARLPEIEFVLYDTDRARLDRIMPVICGLEEEAGRRVVTRLAEDLDDALDGADFVISAIRAGGFESRRLDETIAMSHGVLGQETVGPGGFSLALRNVPALTHVAQRMQVLCPDAWLINLTNPAGIVTQALAPLLDGRVVGVCDSPLALSRGVAGALGISLADLHVEYAGLNHLGWLTAVWHRGRNVLPDLLASPDLEQIEEAQLFGVEAVRALGAVPNEYVYFYERTDEAITNIRRGGMRGAFLLGEQRSLTASLDAADSQAEALAGYRRSLQTRNDTYMTVEAQLARRPADDAFQSAGGYHEMALSVVEAIACDRPTVIVVDTPNRGALDFLADDDVVEVPSIVRAAGVFPLSSRVPNDGRPLVTRIKAFERATVTALERPSVESARHALAHHPMVSSEAEADAILRDYLAYVPGLADSPWAL